MSTRVVRTISDFARHRMDIDVLCYCGHKARLPWHPVVARFVERNWPRGLDAALPRFKCSRCGSTARHIGPVMR